MPHSPQFLLQLLQRFTKHPHQTKQVLSLLITNGHLLPKSNGSSNLKWMNTLLYNALIRAHLNLGDAHKTILLFTHMLAHQAPPNNYTFPSLIKAASSSVAVASLTGISLHTQVVKRGLSLDPFIQTSFVNLYGQLGNLFDARHMFEEISQPCIVACNAMLDALGRNGDMKLAVLLFERMPERDVFSWTTVINGFGSNGYFGEAIMFFEKMMSHQDVVSCLVKPNEATFVSVLSSCANMDTRGDLYIGKQIHAYIIKNEIELTVFMGTALIALYGKMGCLGTAMHVFNKLVLKEVCAWNAMILSLASNGRENQALAMFQKMKMEGLYPNEVSFVAALTACARAKLVESGLELIQSMITDFGIIPKMEHYGCVVDLLGRAGLLKEAIELVRKMPFEPDASVLGALLGACKVHGAVELGNELGRRLLELQPRHCGRYVALSNLFAGADRWGHAADLRKAMVEAGIGKIPAYSRVDYL
ncbi:putative pentatricopeptide repeat-containing protein At1g10330 [Malania oleifera]|uniref:putative pentatricopeptide repeat-containing protein At1g10330 n=1 Tax=Malania oleifera TaxID=397392 RepID=UPI0025AE5977|nr:putative pentatricopeptide repeat-containing protein At1g10330 [Malania oleifera]